MNQKRTYKQYSKDESVAIVLEQAYSALQGVNYLVRFASINLAAESLGINPNMLYKRKVTGVAARYRA